MPGISAVSPPMSAQPLAAQPRAIPEITLRLRSMACQLAWWQGSPRKKQRLRALHRNVVHAVIDQVFTHGVMAVRGERDFELGANAIDRADQHRLTHLRQREAAAEGVNNVGKDAFWCKVERAILRMAPTARFGFVDIDANVLIGNGTGHI